MRKIYSLFLVLIFFSFSNLTSFAQIGDDSLRSINIERIASALKNEKSAEDINHYCPDTIVYINLNKMAVRLVGINQKFLSYNRCYVSSSDIDNVNTSSVYKLIYRDGSTLVYNSDLETIKRTYFAGSIIQSDCNDMMVLKDGKKLKVKIIGVTGNLIYYLTKRPFDRVHKRVEFAKVSKIKFDYKPNNYNDIVKAHPTIKFSYRKIKDLALLTNEAGFNAGKIFVLLGVIEVIDTILNN